MQRTNSPAINQMAIKMEPKSSQLFNGDGSNSMVGAAQPPLPRGPRKPMLACAPHTISVYSNTQLHGLTGENHYLIFRFNIFSFLC
jgi:hypothetical protein